MSNPNPEINYPVSSTVLIDYLTKCKMLCPFFIGTTCWQFSTEIYWGRGSERPPKDKLITVKIDESLTKESIEQILIVLDLPVDDFEKYVQCR